MREERRKEGKKGGKEGGRKGWEERKMTPIISL
jgi:hypothetical protein